MIIFISDTREIAFGILQSTLAEKDLELAVVHNKLDELNGQLTELRRISRRETVNMDYLKNIILQVIVFLFLRHL